MYTCTSAAIWSFTSTMSLTFDESLAKFSGPEILPLPSNRAMMMLSVSDMMQIINMELILKLFPWPPGSYIHKYRHIDSKQEQLIMQ